MTIKNGLPPIHPGVSLKGRGLLGDCLAACCLGSDQTNPLNLQVKHPKNSCY